MTREAYSFGRIVLNGQEYRSDLVVYPDGRIDAAWWRKKGHELSAADITSLIESKPEVIVVGTGAGGLLRVDPALQNALNKQGIRCEALPTAEAVKRYNTLRQQGVKVGACFHLTC